MGEVKCAFCALRYKFLAEFGIIRRNNGATSSGRYIAATFPRGEGSGSAARRRIFPHTSLSEAKAERNSGKNGRSKDRKTD